MRLCLTAKVKLRRTFCCKFLSSCELLFVHRAHLIHIVIIFSFLFLIILHVEISAFILFLIESSSRALQRYHFFIHSWINLYAYTFRGYKYSFMSLSLKGRNFMIYWTRAGGGKSRSMGWKWIFYANWYSKVFYASTLKVCRSHSRISRTYFKWLRKSSMRS